MFCYLNICWVTSFWVHNKDAMSKPHDLYFCLPDAINKAPRNLRRDTEIWEKKL